jgi:hypothetical protein
VRRSSTLIVREEGEEMNEGDRAALLLLGLLCNGHDANKRALFEKAATCCRCRHG